MTNTTNSQPVCPCNSGDVNYSREGHGYCPWCEYDYGKWVLVDGWHVLVQPIDYSDTSLSEPAVYEDAAMEAGLYGWDA